MLCLNDIKVEFESQGYKATHLGISPDSTKTVLFFESNMETKDVSCPLCGSEVYVHDNYQTHLTDIPLKYGMTGRWEFFGKRYKCRKCGHSFVNETPFCYPGTRITERAATWIKGMLKNKVSIRSIQELTGIHWDTIRKVQIEYMQGMIESRQDELRQENYHPKYLAVDEFAIHKGHTYATCVMDIETGEVIWAGKGRTMEDFRHFFEDMDKEFLSKVKAVAMDMNAAYNRLVAEYLPNAEIVYDRYHFQADFGKNVLGCVRLDEAREHKAKAECLKDKLQRVEKHTERVKLKRQIREEQSLGSAVKRARWLILAGSDKLKSQGQITLQDILDTHTDIALCYAMKEELCRLFALNDRQEAEHGWKSWFEAGKASEVEHLNRFAKTKEFRLQGLIAHAEHPISTGKLEGLNNKIKVAKRIAYGYRNDSYFFTLVRFISLPSHAKT